MKNFDQKIEAYLRGSMAETERRLFEVELNENPDLKKAAIQYALGPEPAASGWEDEVQQAIRRARETTGAGRKPTVIKLSDKIRYFFLFGRYRKWPWRLTGLAACIGLAVYLGWPEPRRALIEQNVVIDCGDQAGATPDWNLKNKAAYLACGVRPGGADSLIAISGAADSFNIANMYLAYWYLKTDQYPKAAAEYEKCLLHEAEINRYDLTNSQMVQFNLLLAQLGAASNPRDIYPRLVQFMDRYPEFEPAQNIRRSLRNPLRLWVNP